MENNRAIKKGKFSLLDKTIVFLCLVELGIIGSLIYYYYAIYSLQ